MMEPSNDHDRRGYPHFDASVICQNIGACAGHHISCLPTVALRFIYLRNVRKLRNSRILRAHFCTPWCSNDDRGVIWLPRGYFTSGQGLIGIWRGVTITP